MTAQPDQTSTCPPSSVRTATRAAVFMPGAVPPDAHLGAGQRIVQLGGQM